MPVEIRLARQGDIVRQKEIWKQCFDDSDDYIDFFYAGRYRDDKTAIFLRDGAAAAMLTMIPVRTVYPGSQRTFPGKCSVKTVMLYAIATHPSYQRQGSASQLMDFVVQHLRTLGTKNIVLVPARKELFEFYRKQGYEKSFYLRETKLTREEAETFSKREKQQSLYVPKETAPMSGIKAGAYYAASASPDDYNLIRNRLLQGRRYISYDGDDIGWQKKMSQRTGADIYSLVMEGAEGCFAAERISSDKVLVKELLLPEKFLPLAVQGIIRQLPAKEYIIRTPPHLGEDLGGMIRPFGMARAIGDNEETGTDLGYLGFAFD